MDFRVMSWDKDESLAADLAKMGNRWFVSEPKLRRRFTVVCRRTRKVGEVCSGSTELIPHVGGSVTGGFHGACFVKEGAMQPFSTTVVCGCIRSGEEVKDTLFRAPFLYLEGG